MQYLRPFAESGREVREEDVNAFFESRKTGNVAGPGAPASEGRSA